MHFFIRCIHLTNFYNTIHVSTFSAQRGYVIFSDCQEFSRFSLCGFPDIPGFPGQYEPWQIPDRNPDD